MTHLIIYRKNKARGYHNQNKQRHMKKQLNLLRLNKLAKRRNKNLNLRDSKMLSQEPTQIDQPEETNKYNDDKTLRIFIKYDCFM